MKRSKSKVLRFRRWAALIGGTLGAGLLVWGTGLLFCPSIVLIEYSSNLQRNLYPAGMRFRSVREGFAETSIGKDGRVAPQFERQNATDVYCLWGSSFVEAMQVPESCKIHAVANHQLAIDGNQSAGVVNLGYSGAGICDYLASMPGYQKQFSSRLNGYVILLAGLSDYLPRDSDKMHAGVARNDSGWIIVLPQPQATSTLNRWKYDLGLNAWNVLVHKLITIQPDFSLGPHASMGAVHQAHSISMDEFESFTEFWMGELKKRSAGLPVLIIWGEEQPGIADGKILPATVDTPHELFIRNACKRYGFDFITMTPSFNKLAAEKFELVTGFQNTVPGIGHYNEQGNALVGEAVAKWIEKRGEK